MTLTEQLIVLMIMGSLLAIFFPLLSEFRFLQSSEDQATTLARHMSAARNTAIKSNRLVLFEFDFEEDEYQAYTFNRESGELKKDVLIETTGLRLAAIASASGKRNTDGKLTLRMQPSGVTEETAIYLGADETEVYATLLFSRYTGRATVKTGEVRPELEQPQWKHEPE